jgi:hypothetical protein
MVQNVSDTSSQPGWVTVAEAARALGISETAVRKRIHAGTIASRGEPGATQVQISVVGNSQPGSQLPQLEFATDATHEVARLTGENAELRARLADAQADRDRWHASATAAIERYNHDMQEMRGLLGREQVIALSASTAATAAGDVAQEMPQERDTATESDAPPTEVSESLLARLRHLIGR